MTAPEPPNHAGIVEVVRTWRTPKALRLAEGWTLELAATGDDAIPGGECTLKVKGPSAAVEALLQEADAQLRPLL